MLGIDLPANPRVHGHAHLLAGEGSDLLHLITRLITREGIVLFPRREALHRRPGRDHADAGQQRLGIHEAEGVPHPDLARVDDDERGAERDNHAQHQRHVAEATEHAADRAPAAALRADGGRAEAQKEGDGKEYEPKDELAHGDSGM